MFLRSGVIVIIINCLIEPIWAGAYYNHRHVNQFITRDDWMAEHVNEEIENLNLPVTRVIVAHTVTPGCQSESTCSARVRSIQNYHMNSKHWPDIGYNFLIGGDGGIYVGRGWNKLGTHTAGENSNSIGVALIGTFTHVWPSRKQLSALKYLIEKGVHLKKLSADYVIYPQRALMATASPGDKVVNSINNWSHYYTNYNIPEIFVRSGIEDVNK